MRRFGKVEHGFSLVEALVALAVGMVTVVVIMQALGNAEAQRRMISSGGDANSSGTIALQLLQRDVLNAGFGMSIAADGVADSDLYSACGALPLEAHNLVRALGDGSLGPQLIQLPARSLVPVTRFDARSSGTGITAPTPAYLTAPFPGESATNPTGFDADTDILQITYSGASSFIGAGVPIQSSFAASRFQIHTSGALATVSKRTGIHQGDIVVVGDSPARTSDTPPRVPCIVAQATHVHSKAPPPSAAWVDDCGVTTTTDLDDTAIWYRTGTYRNWHRRSAITGSCENDTAVWNSAALPSAGGSYTVPRIYTLGSPDRFVMRAYGIRRGQLTVCNPLLQDCTNSGNWATIADGIVSMRVMLGIDGNSDNAVTPPTYAANGTITALNEWNRNLPAHIVGTLPTPASPLVRWNQFRSIHIAIVARSATLQRDPIATATCQPDWAGYRHDDTVAPSTRTCGGTVDNANGQFWLASGYDGANWQRYPARVFETTVPIRSLFWSNN